MLCLNSFYNRDIVDTTYVKDNFIKMLVGASRADYDAEGNGSDPEHE